MRFLCFFNGFDRLPLGIWMCRSSFRKSGKIGLLMNLGSLGVDVAVKYREYFSTSASGLIHILRFHFWRSSEELTDPILHGIGSSRYILRPDVLSKRKL